ncbi:hypothetical protein CI109_101647 [Kwoniella shandongensis]|uniref:Uncharacterized protein n=1 Tax=Kwoniella shandongensis TaxID=1734106 RepID=A0A5M6CAF3_9TREE|nr:uncharacterized protein CI109_001228 [Kwoniella shandongensis]KAA5530425.1 hypothetical protein CI109_001228 [Kwoniella shandongensis]
MSGTQRPAQVVTTEGLLKDIGTGTAAELIMAVRYNTSPPGPTFIPPLDELILEGRPHPGGSSLQRGDLVELVGGSGSGKTSFLIFQLLTTLLPASLAPTPPSLLPIPIGGRSQHATLIQPYTHRSLIPSLRRSMRSHILSVHPTAGRSTIDDIIKESLGRFRVYRIKPRWKEVALCLRHILDGLSAMATGTGGGEREGGVDLLVIDGLGDAYYPTRWTDEERGKRTGSGGGGGTGKVVGADEVGMREVMQGIGRVRKDLGSVVMISVQGLRTSRETQPFFLSHLPSPYPQPFSPQHDDNTNHALVRSSPTHWPLNIQITLTGPVRTLQYPGETTLVDALREKVKSEQQEQEGSRGRRYEGLVRMEGVNGGLVGTRGGGKFGFRISDEGVQVWGEA